MLLRTFLQPDDAPGAGAGSAMACGGYREWKAEACLLTELSAVPVLSHLPRPTHVDRHLCDSAASSMAVKNSIPLLS